MKNSILNIALAFAGVAALSSCSDFLDKAPKEELSDASFWKSSTDAEMYISDKGEDLFVTKVNWEIEIQMNMSKIFVPMTMENLVRMLDDKEASRLKKLVEEMLQKQSKDKKHDHDSNGGNSMMGGMGGMMNGLGGLKNMGSGMNGTMRQN